MNSYQISHGPFYVLFHMYIVQHCISYHLLLWVLSKDNLVKITLKKEWALHDLNHGPLYIKSLICSRWMQCLPKFKGGTYFSQTTRGTAGTGYRTPPSNLSCVLSSQRYGALSKLLPCYRDTILYFILRFLHRMYYLM